MCSSQQLHGKMHFPLLMYLLFILHPLSDNCKKMGLVFDDVVGIVEVINCRDVKVQVCTTYK